MLLIDAAAAVGKPCKCDVVGACIELLNPDDTADAAAAVADPTGSTGARDNEVGKLVDALCCMGGNTKFDVNG